MFGELGFEGNACPRIDPAFAKGHRRLIQGGGIAGKGQDADTTQRLTSSLAALDAAHRSACEARQQAIETDVRCVGEQITEQFRQSLRAFFYSCLVAAVGAVEQHSKTTAEGLSFDPKKFSPPEP